MNEAQTEMKRTDVQVPEDHTIVLESESDSPEPIPHLNSPAEEAPLMIRTPEVPMIELDRNTPELTSQTLQTETRIHESRVQGRREYDIFSPPFLQK